MVLGHGGSVGIIGAGPIGRALAQHLVRAEFEVVIANSRGPETLRDIVTSLGPHVRAGSLAEAVEPEIVFLALPYSCIADAVASVVNWEGRIIVDPTNPSRGNGHARDELSGRGSSAIVAGLVPGAQVVKAFNGLHAPILATHPSEGQARRVVFYASDHASAKREFARLVNRMGFAGIDLGHLADGDRLLAPPEGALAMAHLLLVERG
jgi:predicted dinucleotide-binding enzyme